MTIRIAAGAKAFDPESYRIQPFENRLPPALASPAKQPDTWPQLRTG
jgi:hypothetical protein